MKAYESPEISVVRLNDVISMSSWAPSKPLSSDVDVEKY